MTGGTARPFLNPRETAPAWSPDGKQLAYMAIPAELESGDPLFVADGSGANPREIIRPEPKVHIHNPVWSLDGQWIYFVARHGSGGRDGRLARTTLRADRQSNSPT